MASLYRLGKKGIYTAMWRDAKGEQWSRSTKSAVRKTAQEIADAWETASRTPPARLTMQQVQKVMSEIYKSVTGQEMLNAQLDAYLPAWLETRRPELGEQTCDDYGLVIDSFVESMQKAQRGDISIFEVTKNDVLRWRAELEKQKSISTITKYIKILRLPFTQAKGDGLLADNPASHVKPPNGKKGNKKKEKKKRKPYKHGQLSQVLEACDDEWQSMVVHGYYTAQRLVDIALMTEKQIDLVARQVKFVEETATQKTGREVIVEMNDDYHHWALSRPTSDDPEAYVHPRASATVLRSKSKRGGSTLSNQFATILWKAGLRAEKPRHKKKDEEAPGRGGRRIKNDLVFHSLRHTLNSDLANAGVPRLVMMDIVGHDDEASNRGYTHVESKVKREAMKKLPNIIPGKKGKQLDLGLDGQGPEEK